MNENIVNSWRKKQNASKWFIATLIILFSLIAFYGTAHIIADNKCASCNVYKAMGFIIIMVWLCIFLCYYIWAIYFYNFNLGLTNEEWNKIKEAKNNRSKGAPYNENDIEAEPEYNPYKDETFGLPPGTVRGTIALTLLFGAIAMLIVSFGMSNELTPGNFFLDQFEFFKTAFLMMIAFYFGSSSLKFLRKENTGSVKLGDNNTKKTENTDNNPSGLVSAADSGEIVVINYDNPPQTKGTIPPIVAIDPMNPKKS